MSGPPLGPRFTEAFAYAYRLHLGQRRKKTGAPYISHLMAVCALVLESGGDEEEAIAALLHDGPEDSGGRPTLEEIRRRFGDRVADIVAGCTDTLESPRPPWPERKRAYLRHLPEASPSTLLVSAADKLHNLRSLLVAYRQAGEELWSRFSATRDEVLGYHRSLLEIFRRRAPRRARPLVIEIERALGELERLVERLG